MKSLFELAVILAAYVLAILCVFGMVWFLMMVIAPLGWAIAGLFVGLLAIVIGMMSLFRAQR